MRNWVEGTGGLTVRETHQAMEAIASQGGLKSFSASSISAGRSSWVVETTLQIMLSALGKRIL
jgi:arginase family enzyme